MCEEEDYDGLTVKDYLNTLSLDELIDLCKEINLLRKLGNWFLNSWFRSSIFDYKS